MSERDRLKILSGILIAIIVIYVITFIVAVAVMA